MIPNEIGVIGLARFCLRIGIEVCDDHGVVVQSPQQNVFFQWDVCVLFTCLSAHKKTPIYRSDVSASSYKNMLILSAKGAKT